MCLCVCVLKVMFGEGWVPPVSDVCMHMYSCVKHAVQTCLLSLISSSEKCCSLVLISWLVGFCVCMCFGGCFAFLAWCKQTNKKVWQKVIVIITLQHSFGKNNPGHWFSAVVVSKLRIRSKGHQAVSCGSVGSVWIYDQIDFFFFFLQRTCFLSINPLKEESVDTEKVQYTLPDGNTVEVSAVNARWNVDWDNPVHSTSWKYWCNCGGQLFQSQMECWLRSPSTLCQLEILWRSVLSIPGGMLTEITQCPLPVGNVVEVSSVNSRWDVDWDNPVHSASWKYCGGQFCQFQAQCLLR